MNKEIKEMMDRIPDEYTVREMLGQNHREAAMLRRLLAVAKKKTDAQPSPEKTKPKGTP